MRQTHTSDAFRALRIGSALLLCVALAGLLLILGEASAAIGVGIGFALFAGNGFLLIEVGRSLLGSGRRVRPGIALSAVGRLLLLGIVLAAVFLFLGRSAGVGACGGLLASQVNLHFPIRRTGVAT